MLAIDTEEAGEIVDGVRTYLGNGKHEPPKILAKKATLADEGAHVSAPRKQNGSGIV